MRSHLRQRFGQQVRRREVVLAGHRKKLFRCFRRIRVDQRFHACIHLRAERVVRFLEVRSPLALPRTRQRRRAVHRTVQPIQLVHHLMHGHAVALMRCSQVGLHIGPRQNQRTAVPRFADQLVIPLVQYAGGIHVAAMHAERIGVDDQLRPALQPDLAELQQRQAT
ncbi:hypothetical protein D3C73_998680 [compost metagenome]